VVPENKKDKKYQEHFEISSKDNHFTEDMTIEELPTKPISIVNNTTSIEPTEDLLRLLPNASIIYIYDLKVTQYQKLYFKKMKPFVLEVNGLSAQFENSDEYKSYLKDKSFNNNYTLDMLLKDALKLFNKQKHKQAFTLFNELLNYNSNDPNAFFYSGMCQYYTGNNEDAIARFNNVIDNENNVFHQEAEWYKALCLSKQKSNKEAAITLLTKINNQKGFYAIQAGEKLKELSLDK
jgi:tetratricopeptide (TPR) repeat protein